MSELARPGLEREKNPTTLPEGSLWRFRKHGLDILVSHMRPGAERIYQIPYPSLIGYTNFNPLLRTRFEHETISENLLQFFLGFNRFFAEVDQGATEPDYLVGETNWHMADFSQRLSFTTNPPTRPRPKGYEEIKYRVTGETKAVRRQLESLLAKTTINGSPIIGILRARAS